MSEPARVLKTSPESVLRFLLIDDNPDDRALVRRAVLKDHPGAKIQEIADRESLDAAVASGDFDIVITDFALNWCDGLTVLRATKERYPDCPVIMFTGTGNEEVAVEAMKSGLDDYVVKSPQRLVRLSASIRASLERAQERRAMRESEGALQALKKAVDTLTIGVTITDTRGRIVYNNPAEARLHGYAPHELLGREARMLVPSEYWRPFSEEQIREMRPWKRERTNLRKDGTTFPAQLLSDVVRSPSGEPMALVTICEDITERKRIEEQLRRNAFFDPLTGLPNRALLIDRLGRAVQRSKRRRDLLFAVLFLDLDRFKLVNDSLGHTVGDHLLVETARRLEAALRPSDTVSRLGGDEFVILADEIRDLADVLQIAERTQQELSQPHHLEGHEVFTTVSIGIALSTRGYSDPDEVLRDADAAMYRAKAKGRARHEVFGDEMLTNAKGLLRLETELRRALDRGEFQVHYQPIVSLRTGETLSAEALVRWLHPERGLLLPEDFIRVAEETGLISPLGEWVIRESCARAREWRRRGLTDLRLSINLSPRQFRQEDLPKKILKAVEAGGGEPRFLDLELTESTLMENLAESVSSLLELKALGMRISIDDFGTGYSSLSYLRRLPVDILKIDQSFVAGITTDRRGAAIASSVIALAHSLDLTVVAEGVETEAQLAFLSREQCEAMQGYVFSPPVPPDAFEAVVRRNGRSA